MSDQADEYGTVVVSRHIPTVEEAPDRGLMSVGLLRDLDQVYLYDLDLIYIGRTADGHDVFYRITGWDPEHKALIIERDHR